MTVLLCAQFDSRDISQPNDAWALPTFDLSNLDDDVAELLRINQAAECVDRKLKLLTAWSRGLPKLSGGNLDVLILDRVDDVIGRQLQRSEFIWLQPDPHAVVTLPHIRHIPNIGKPCELIANLDRGIVAQVQVVVAWLAGGRIDLRSQIHDHQRTGRLLLHRDALPLHQGRDQRQRKRHAVLHQDLSHLEVSAKLEGDGQFITTVVSADRRHVQHVLNAIDLLLDGCGDRVTNNVGVGSRILCGNDDGRRCDVRVLGNRQRECSGTAGKRDHNREHGRKNRMIDAEA